MFYGSQVRPQTGSNGICGGGGRTLLSRVILAPAPAKPETNKFQVEVQEGVVNGLGLGSI